MSNGRICLGCRGWIKAGHTCLRCIAGTYSENTIPNKEQEWTLKSEWEEQSNTSERIPKAVREIVEEINASEEQGDELKKDYGKADISLLPYEFLEGVAKVLDFGAKKYSRYGWASKDMAYTRIIAAAYRHLGKFEKGEQVDEETKLSHLLHLTCCAMFLYMYSLTGLGKDDRWKR